MTTKKIQFDYEYFKKNPETKLETRDGDEAVFIGYNSICVIENFQLVFGAKNKIITTTIDGFYINNKSVCELDISMLVESKEVVRYANVYQDLIGNRYNSLDDAIRHKEREAISVAKITILDGELIKTETVHKY